MNRSMITLLLAAALSQAIPGTALAQVYVDAEASRTPPARESRWRAPDLDRQASQLRYPELPLQRIVALQKSNDSAGAGARKPLQIGLGRASSGTGAKSLSSLEWRRLDDGSHAARLAITSPVAMGLRVGLRMQGLPPDAELRFQGSERPLGDILLASGREVMAATPQDGLYWTPITDGETQSIEIWLPPGRSPDAVRVSAPELSHLLTNTRRDFKILPKIGESASCNIDTACHVAALGPGFEHAKNAVAHMTFNYYNANGTLYGTFLCTGTLLNDTVPGTQVPWFYTADHCFAGGIDGVPAQDRSRVAASLNTHWNYEATSCSSGVSTARTTLGGGADVLFNDPDPGTDAILLRLRNAPPAFATFAGWNAGPIAANSDVVTIHHPSGDAKKVSFGRHVPAASDSVSHGVGWLQGTTEGGSSGSGLFTRDSDGHYRLRGGLYGGYASCASSGNLSNTDNRDWYSRLDVVFPKIRQYIAPQPSRGNGAQPLRP
jgi:lysyl endopeptidase